MEPLRKADFAQLHTAAQRLHQALNERVVGQKDVVELTVLTVLCSSHTLLTGAPGVAKTTLVRNLASALGCGWKRIQFTPDLTPFDILGGEVLEFVEGSGENRRVVFSPGPIFSPFLLADEINRASPRTQSALLEAMQERQVTVAGQTRALPKPFFVFATQNPIENEGTFPLPEAQLDRFLFNIEVPYPEFEAELRIATQEGAMPDVEPIPEGRLLIQARPLVESIRMSPAVVQAAVRLVRNTRPQGSALAPVKRDVDFGASPRASMSLVLAAKALALLRGQDEAGVEHIMTVAPSVLRHRVIPSFAALSEGRTSNDIVRFVLSETVL